MDVGLAAVALQQLPREGGVWQPPNGTRQIVATNAHNEEPRATFAVVPKARKKTPMKSGWRKGHRRS